jgi:SAM-dependent methyltransferase
LAVTLPQSLRRHGWLRFSSTANEDVAVKPAVYLPVYEEVLGGLRYKRFTLLELGVWKGDSLAMWQKAFRRASIIGVDLAPPDVQLGPRVAIVEGDQADPALLTELRSRYAPQGFDVIVDDASHVGSLSARSLQALYTQHLKPGGIYVIEDWGTGYLAQWPEGSAPNEMVGSEYLDHSIAAPECSDTARRMPSHDFGMVGLVKRLIDHAARNTIAVHNRDWVAEPLPIAWMRVQDGLVIIKKSA